MDNTNKEKADIAIRMASNIGIITPDVNDPIMIWHLGIPDLVHLSVFAYILRNTNRTKLLLYRQEHVHRRVINYGAMKLC